MRPKSSYENIYPQPFLQIRNLMLSSDTQPRFLRLALLRLMLQLRLQIFEDGLIQCLIASIGASEIHCHSCHCHCQSIAIHCSYWLNVMAEGCATRIYSAHVQLNADYKRNIIFMLDDQGCVKYFNFFLIWWVSEL